MPAAGTAIGTIRIPAIGVNYVFSAGTDEPELAKGPGVWLDGAYPGTPGNTTISGHRTTHGAYYRNLDKLHYGDLIYIDIPGQPEAAYQVRGAAVVLPSDVSVTASTPGVRLTLTACTPAGWATHRLVIEAEEVSGAFASKALPASAWSTLAPAGDVVPLSSHPGETVGQLDPTAL